MGEGSDLFDLYKAIGELGGKVDGIASRLDEFSVRSAAESKYASQTRQRLYERVEDVGRQALMLDGKTKNLEAALSEIREWTQRTDTRLANIESSIKGHDAAISEFKPTAVETSRWKQRLIGAGVALALFASLFGDQVGHFKDNLWKMFGG